MSRPANISLTLALLLVILSSAFAVAPVDELGLPYITSYVPDDYDGIGQNWGITQAENGMMYLANGEGVFEYDGVDWNWLETEHNRTARSIAAGAGHVVYVGYHNEIGFFKPDSSGSMTYTSLTPQISDSLLGFRDVWTTLVHNNYVYYNPIGQLFRWEINENGPIDGTLYEIAAGDERFQGLTVIDNDIYMIIPESGIVKLVGDKFEQLPGSNHPDLHPVWSILPFPGDKLLLAGYSGMLVYDGTKIVEWDTDISEYTVSTGAYNATSLGDGYYALGTDNDGVALFDSTGSILRIINRDLGMPNNQVLTYPYLDKEGGVWICFEYGLARINLISELQRYNHELGLEGGTISIRRYKDDLYVGTSQGLYRPEKQSEPGRPIQFSEIGSMLFCWDMVEIAGQLLLAGNGDLQVIKDKGLEPEMIEEGVMPFTIAVDSTYDRAFVGCTDGPVYTYVFRDGEWRNEGELLNLDLDVMWLTRARDGAIWANYGFDSLSVARITVNQDYDSVELADVQFFTEESGHYVGSPGVPFQWGNDFLIAGLDELYRYDLEAHDLVVADNLNIYEMAKEKGINIPSNAPDGSLWFEDNSGVCNHFIPLDDGGFKHETPLRRNSKTGYNSFYTENGTLWAGLVGSDLVRYNSHSKTTDICQNLTLIRNVRMGTDSVLFHGSENRVSLIGTPLDWGNRTVRIAYALPSFEDVSRNEYQVRLIGLSDTWSEWTDDTRQLYNNLAAGQYRFEVRGRDVHDSITDIATVQFVVNAPWYATWWAITIWAFIIISLVFSAITLRLRAIEHRNRLLDKAVKERTAEVERLLVKEQESEIKASQMETAYKMAATIAHEFNNPLAIIQASAQLMAKDVFTEQKLREFAEKIPPQVSRLKYLLQRITNVQELREIDYAAGMKILDIHDGNPPNGQVVQPEAKTPSSQDRSVDQQD